VTALRLEGHAPSVAFRAAALASLGRAIRLEAADSARFWTEIGAVRPLLPAGGRIVWRVCPTPSAAPDVLAAVRRQLESAEGFYDWGGGLLWLSLDPVEASADAGAAVVRHAVRAAGGHATLIVAAEATRETVPVFEPEQPALAALSVRVKDSFDPRRILNPGRMQEGR
jgi:glycolate oxidase FAD binding subunit